MIEAGGGRREEAVEVLVAVVLVADVPEDEVPGLLGEHDRIRPGEETVVDREEQTEAPNVGSRAAVHTVAWRTRRHTLSGRSRRSLSQSTVGFFLRSVSRLTSSAWQCRSRPSIALRHSRKSTRTVPAVPPCSTRRKRTVQPNHGARPPPLIPEGDHVFEP
ncbi:hypothetical protein [Streptomyces sp. NPDC054794]